MNIDLNTLINLFQFTISFSNTRACFFSALIYFSVHKSIFQCTNIFFSAQIYFSVHKYISSAQIYVFLVHEYVSVYKYVFSQRIYFPVHKCIFQCTNMFFSARIYFPLHQYVTGYDGGQVTIVFPRLTNGLPFCITKTITTRREGLFNSILESMFCPQDELVPRGHLLLC